MGKKVSDFLKSEIISSIFYLAFGLCLILIPEQTVNIICKIIFGLVMIAAGIYHIVIYAAEKRKATILDLFTGVIVMVLGIFLFFTPQIVIRILPYLLGAFVLVDSIWKIKGSYRLKKAERERWKIVFIGCLVFIALGVSMLFYSFMSVTKMILFSGAILTANGAADVVFLVMLRLGMRKSDKLCSAEKQADTQQEVLQPAAPESKHKVNLRKKTKNEDSSENTGLNEEYQEDLIPEEEIKNDTEPQAQKTEIEPETEKTADAADADVILDGSVLTEDEEAESPGKEIKEMLGHHDEPLEEWKD